MTAHCIDAKSVPKFCINCGRRHAGTCDATAEWVRAMPRTIEPTDAQRARTLETVLTTAHSALLAGNVDYAIEVIGVALQPEGHR